MAVENGYGAELDMVVDEENQDTTVDKNERNDDAIQEKSSPTKTVKSSDKDDETSVVMEVVEDIEDPLADTGSDDKVITPSKKSDDKADTSSTEPVVTEYVKEYSGPVSVADNKTSPNKNGTVSDKEATPTNLPASIKVKEEPSEVVLIDSEDEKEEKPKVKVTRNSMTLRQNPKPNTIYSKTHVTSHSKGNGDFQIVSVDDDSPMNKNDPMNVFLCSNEEREFRKEYFKDPSSNVLKQRLHCTICDIHIGACPQNSKNMVCHRFLKVLVCRKCANFYGQGEFPQDEGSDEFCRWCGEGGEVFLCNTCSNVFCQACILRNFGVQEVRRVDRLDNWDCYVCDPRPLWTLRAIAFALFTYVRRIKVVAYRNGMYQTISSANAKISKSDLMALETDLSTCCPKEVKEAVAAASAAQNDATNNSSTSNIPPPLVSLGLKAKDNKVPIPPPRVAVNNKSPAPGVSILSSPSTFSPQLTPGKRAAGKQTSPGQQWAQNKAGSKYIPGQGKKVPLQRGMNNAGFANQSTLRSALTVGAQSSFSGFDDSGSENKSDNVVLQWFNGVVASLMDTMKNIDNRLVFIRNSTSNLISQNEVSFLVNQLHNLLKVSSSKMQEVDCDLLKNYKEFIDKSEITVNDFDDIVREFPEFFKPPENNEEPPEDVESEPEPPDDINPMALVEVIEEGDQQSSSSGGKRSRRKDSSGSGNAKKAVADSASEKRKSNAMNDSSYSMLPCSVTIKKETVSDDITSDATVGSSNGSSGRSTRRSRDTSGKRKTDAVNVNDTKKGKYDTVRIKMELEDGDDGEQTQNYKQCSVKLTDVNVSNDDDRYV